MLEYPLVAFALLWSVHATPTGNHTCTGVVKHEVTVRVNVTEPVTFRAYEWCLRVPPRCSTYTIQLKDRVKIHKEMHNRTITVCCKGYVEIDYKCVPACPPENECPNMHCNRTNHCYCTPGYTGLYCNHPCPKGVWGAGCIKPCDCPSGYTCHYLTGDCMLDDSPPQKTRRTTTTAVELLTEPATTLETSRPTTTRPPTTVSTTRLTDPPTTRRQTEPPTTTPTTTTTERPSTKKVPTTTTEATTPTQTTIASTQKETPTTITKMVSTTIKTTARATTTAETTERTGIKTQIWPIVQNAGPSPETTIAPQSQTTEELQTTTATTDATTQQPTTESTTRINSNIEQTTSKPAVGVQSETMTSPVTSHSASDEISLVTLPKTTTDHITVRITDSTTPVPSTTSTTQLPTTVRTTELRTEPSTPQKTTVPLRTVPVLEWDSTQPPVDVTLTQATSTQEVTTQAQPSSPSPTVVFTSRTATSPTTTTTEEKPSTTTIGSTTITSTEPTTELHIPIEQETSATTTTTTAPTTHTSGKVYGRYSEATSPTESKLDVFPMLETTKWKSTNKSTSLTDVSAHTSVELTHTTQPYIETEKISTETKIGEVAKTAKKDSEEMQRSTTDASDRLIVEDVPKPQKEQKTATSESPIKRVVDEVISKYFPDAFLKAGEGFTNKSSNQSEEDDEKPFFPWSVHRKEVGAIGIPESSTSQTVRSTIISDAKKRQQKPTSPITTTMPTTTPIPVTSSIAIITPKVIVSAKNPDEIDLGGVIYRKMKFFPPAKSPSEVTTLPPPLPTTTLSPSDLIIKEQTTLASDRFKIYLPEYEKEMEESETTEAPAVKTFLPKFNFDKEEFDYGKQAIPKKAKQKEKDFKKYKVKPHEATISPTAAEDGSNERVTNNVFLETKEFKVHLTSTKAQKFGEPYYTKAPIEQDSPVYDLSRLSKKKSKVGSGEYESTKFVKYTLPPESQEFDEGSISKTITETYYPTTNPKPPHTWYSHAREKAKIKSALRVMKSTMTLDTNVKPTEDSLMEESNDINSMPTQYTEREARSAVAAAVTYQDDLNNPLMFGQVKFNAPESYSSSNMGSSEDGGTGLGMMSSLAVGSACFMAMASLVALLWLRLKNRGSRIVKAESADGREVDHRRQTLTPSTSNHNYETVYPLNNGTDEMEVATFFCPTFTNNYAERINREFSEMSYDHPRKSFVEPLYAEILHPKIKDLEVQ